MKNWPVICVLALVSQTAGAITTEIPAGTVVNGGDVHTIVTQKVYGEANNFTVSGIQQVMNGRKNVRQRHLPYGNRMLDGGVSYNTAVRTMPFKISTAPLIPPLLTAMEPLT